jgi:hypothetical protein
MKTNGLPTLIPILCVLLSSIGWPVSAAESTTVRVAAISFVPRKFDVQHNAKRLESLFIQAATNGARIAVAPEGALEGYVVNQIIVSENKIVAVDREEEGITYNDIKIPARSVINKAERDRVETEFLSWRKTEMQKRYERTMRKLKKKK